MKRKSIIVMVAVIAMMVSVAFAAPKNKQSINIFDPASVGSVVLQPGDYTVRWEGTGPDVQVTFSRGRTVMATVPATLEPQPNRQDSVTLRPQSAGPAHLVSIQMKESTLRFITAEGSGGQ